MTALADVGPSADSLSMSLAAAMLACALGTCLAELVGIPGFSLGLVAIFASGFASLGVAVNSSFSGGKTTSPFQGEIRLVYRPLQQLNLEKDFCCLSTWPDRLDAAACNKDIHLGQGCGKSSTRSWLGCCLDYLL